MDFPWLRDWLLARGRETSERVGFPARPGIGRVPPACLLRSTKLSWHLSARTS
jgi:hypothetical protein